MPTSTHRDHSALQIPCGYLHYEHHSRLRQGIRSTGILHTQYSNQPLPPTCIFPQSKTSLKSSTMISSQAMMISLQAMMTPPQVMTIFLWIYLMQVKHRMILTIWMQSFGGWVTDYIATIIQNSMVCFLKLFWLLATNASIYTSSSLWCDRSISRRWSTPNTTSKKII